MPINFSKNTSLGLQPMARSSVNSLFEAVLVVVICALFGWFIVLPKKADVDKKYSDLDKLKQQESQLAVEASTVQNLISSLPSHAQDIATLDQALPLDGDTVRLRLLVQSLADSVGVTVGSINIAAQPGGMVVGNKALLADPFSATRSLATLSGTIFVMGSFNQLQGLLQKFETSGRLIDISSISIDQGIDGNLSMNLDFNSYYLDSQ